MNQFNDEWLVKPLLNKRLIKSEIIEQIRSSNYQGSDNYLADKLISLGFIKPAVLGELLEEIFNIPFVDLDSVTIDASVTNVVPHDLCRKFHVFPYKIDDENITIALFDPMNLEAEQEIAHITGRMVQSTLAAKNQIHEKIIQYYNPNRFIEGLADRMSKETNSDISPEVESIDTPLADAGTEEAPIIRLVNSILNDAVDQNASDIHIEPAEKSILIRFRIDGLLKQIMEVPKYAGPQLVSRIKVISKLDIAESRKPQDGKSKIRKGDLTIDLRVSVLPTNYGEKIVIRILDPRNANIPFEKLGITGKNLEKLHSILDLRQGIILASGPTGSGKTTTLYSALNRIKSPESNILTVEDPIEYMIDGVNQVQVNEKAGVTFASALRSFLRQDPDIILVGEIRDIETAEIAIQASLTGHLVLSTLHANSAIETVTRLSDMGIDHYKIGSALSAVIAQRLVRRICTSCKTERPPTDQELFLIPVMEKMGLEPRFYTGEGCPQCHFSGLRGRIGIYEILVVDKYLKYTISDKRSISEIEQIAINNGMKLFGVTAIQYISAGISNYEEISKVLSLHETADLILQKDILDVQADHAVHESFEHVESAPCARLNTDVQKPGDRKIKVMVVEDEPIVQKMVRKIIEQDGMFEVITKTNGLEALESLSGVKPDIMLLDIMMPHMNGFEVCRHVRQTPEFADIPIIMLTALGDQADILKGFEAGADDYIAKPFGGKLLLARLKAVQRRSMVKGVA